MSAPNKTVTLVTPGAAAHYSKSNLDGNFSLLNANFGNFLSLYGTTVAGNTMKGDLDMGNYRIKNIASPAATFDVATKAYVDQTLVIGSTIGTVGSLVVDTDGDTYVKTEVTVDEDVVHIGSVGTDNVQVSATATTFVNNRLVLDTDIRLENLSAGNTIELSDSVATGSIILRANSATLLTLDGTNSNLILGTNAYFSTVNTGITDIDGDTKIILEKTSNDNTIRFYCGGTEILDISSTGLNFPAGNVGVNGNIGVGGSTYGSGTSAALVISEGVFPITVPAGTVIVSGISVGGTDTSLQLKTQLGSLIVLGAASTIPSLTVTTTSVVGTNLTVGGNATITGNLTISGAITATNPLISGAVTVSSMDAQYATFEDQASDPTTTATQLAIYSKSLSGQSRPHYKANTGTSEVVQFLPVGVMLPYAGSTAPTGFLLCDGTAYSRTTYAALFAVASTTYGVGDGSTTFNVPDTRSKNIMGAGTGTLVEVLASQTPSSNLVVVGTNTDKWITGMSTVASSSTITGLSNSTTYFIIRSDATHIGFATSLANAVAGTLVSISGTGVATLTTTFSARTAGVQGGQETHALTSAELTAHVHQQTMVTDITTSTTSAATHSSSGGTTFTATADGGFRSTGGLPTQTALNTQSTGSGGVHNIVQPYIVANHIIKY